MTILVTGATGTIGRQVVRHLIERGQQVRALTRDPSRAVLPEGVEVAAGDLTDAASLEAAFDGVSAVHLINFGGDYQPLTNGRHIVDLAEKAGIGKTTILAGWQEGMLEPAVKSSRLEWTFLQPVQFMANFLTDWGESLRTTGRVREPYGDRKSPPIDEYDIGAVAATVLTQDGHGGGSYHLTGPEVLSARQMVAIIGEATGRHLRFEELTPDQVRREWSVAGGRPHLYLFRAFSQAAGFGAADLVEILLQMYGTPNEYGTTLTDQVEQVTGRPPRTFAQWAAEHARQFLPQPPA
ncbi:SDR family oxidoreductase [Nonomuraea diastatica]|uniref:NAD-dependent epimerase/dehydratase family protein n=1 Tax=Nonomuraea diastatica TaxID=1848329 RepID=A0A4R4W8G3_9ACTN|nr:NmrA family NAD(P)-binding protein [Nonomuraea diastatica]TDD15009.1 NAD-dependent epimerase/dehydratase family protein [Nonomuraea diastatica]